MRSHSVRIAKITESLGKKCENCGENGKNSVTEKKRKKEKKRREEKKKRK